MENKSEFTYMSEKEIVEPIAFFIQDDSVIVANPCSIPIDFLEDAVRQHKAKKPKKTEVSIICLIKIPFKNFKGKLK